MHNAQGFWPKEAETIFVFLWPNNKIEHANKVKRCDYTS